jgi:hypothetical protein
VERALDTRLAGVEKILDSWMVHRNLKQNIKIKKYTLK